ncbi:MAG: hypothetical protein IPO58_15480 [Betaproteobacteria bacterium]|nr:hypothetical protein [Betaproteobacteria bacterium]MBK8738628.1 hypothetical protein [Betaproteobacteria bacterium]MBK9607756.1 hypothetical protein [Betaproteobacteria bacterium]
MDIFATRCPWFIAGPLLGLLVAGLLWAINKPLGALGGMGSTASIVCTMTFMGAAVATANLLALWIGGAP